MGAETSHVSTDAMNSSRVFAYHSKCLFSPQGQFVFVIADKKKGEEERATVF